jgi:hypothetical protein
MRCLALATFDSFRDASRLVSLHFAQAGCSVDFAGVKGRSAREGVAAGGEDGHIWQTTLDLTQFNASQVLAGYDIILASLDGTSMRQLRLCLEACHQRRPLVIAFFPGLLLRHTYDSLATRSWCDLLWLNCRRDMTAYAAMCSAFGSEPSNGRLFGITPLLRTIARTDKAKSGPIVFFEQTAIPSSRLERLFLADQLLSLAIRHPDRQIIIKPRAKPGGISLHSTQISIESAMAHAVQRRNMRIHPVAFCYDSAASLLEKASHCLTINSTVAAEAINARIPTTLISDFGSHDDYGMAYFFGSKVLRTFESMNFNMQVPDVNHAWVGDHIENPQNRIGPLVAEAIEMAEKRAFKSKPLISPTEISPGLSAYLASELGDLGLTRRVHKRSRQSWLKSVLSRLSKIRL